MDMEYTTTTVPEYKPNISEFVDMWKCLNTMGKELGGRYAGFGNLIPPKEWTNNIFPIQSIYSSPRVSNTSLQNRNK